MTYKINGKKLALHILLILASVVMVFPFVWTLSSSLKDLSQIFQVPPSLFPDPWVWENYPRSLSALPFGKAYWNSFLVAVVAVAAQVLTASMAGYAFGKLQFPGHRVVFGLFLATMMVPGQVTMIPLFLMMRELRLLNTLWSLILPAALFNAFGVFLLRQFIRGIPKDLEEAAYVDGASIPRVYFQIVLPLIRPSLSAFGIFVFLGQWNSFLYPLIFLKKPETFTVPLLLNYFKGIYITEYPLLMAGTIIAVVPVLLVYLLFQRQIIEGIAITGIKA